MAGGDYRGQVKPISDIADPGFLDEQEFRNDCTIFKRGVKKLSRSRWPISFLTRSIRGSPFAIRSASASLLTKENGS